MCFEKVKWRGAVLKGTVTNLKRIEKYIEKLERKIYFFISMVKVL
jgi:hypothetical protein